MGKAIVRCAGIVIKENKILLVKSNYDCKIYWILPGGGLHAGESLKECVKSGSPFIPDNDFCDYIDKLMWWMVNEIKPER